MILFSQNNWQECKENCNEKSDDENDDMDNDSEDSEIPNDLLGSSNDSEKDAAIEKDPSDENKVLVYFKPIHYIDWHNLHCMNVMSITINMFKVNCYR